MIDKMREEFEREWKKVSGRTPERSIAMDGQNSYENRVDDAAWWAWQASRESLVIELPAYVDRTEFEDESMSNGYDAALDRCRDAIEAAGLTLTNGQEKARG